MKKVFKKMKKRLSNDGRKSAERSLSRGESKSKGSDEASNRQGNGDTIKKAAPASITTPSVPDCVQPKDTIQRETLTTASTTPAVSEATVTEMPATNAASSESSPPPSTTENASFRREPSKKEGGTADDKQGKKAPMKKDNNNDSAGSNRATPPGDGHPDANKSYTDIPTLEITKLPRGGISIDTKAVGRVQVRALVCFVACSHPGECCIEGGLQCYHMLRLSRSFDLIIFARIPFSTVWHSSRDHQRQYVSRSACAADIHCPC